MGSVNYFKTLFIFLEDGDRNMKVSDYSLLELSEGIKKLSKLDKLTVWLCKIKNVFYFNIIRLTFLQLKSMGILLWVNFVMSIFNWIRVKFEYTHLNFEYLLFRIVKLWGL